MYSSENQKTSIDPCQVFASFLFSLYNSAFFFFFHRLVAENFGNLNMNREHMFGGLLVYIFQVLLQLYRFPFWIINTREKACLCDNNCTCCSFFCFCFFVFLTSKAASQESWFGIYLTLRPTSSAASIRVAFPPLLLGAIFISILFRLMNSLESTTSCYFI